MSVELQAAVREVLIRSAPLVAVVGPQIRPDKLAESDDLAKKPGIILTISQLDDLADLSGVSGPELTATIEVACCAHQRRTATQVERLVKTALDGFRGVAAGVFFESLKYESTKHEFEPADDDGDSKDWYINAASFSVFGRDEGE